MFFSHSSRDAAMFVAGSSAVLSGLAQALPVERLDANHDTSARIARQVSVQ